MSARRLAVIFEVFVGASVHLYVAVRCRAELPCTTSESPLASPSSVKRSIEPVTVPFARSEPASRFFGIARGVSLGTRSVIGGAPRTARSTSVRVATCAESRRARRSASNALLGRGRRTVVSATVVAPGMRRANFASVSTASL